MPPNVLLCGDWQAPAERRYGLSRAMLEVVCELRFPLLVIERSPLLLRDLDLLADIAARAWVGVVLSISTLDRRLKHAFEPRSAGVELRLRAMGAIAARGILVGTALMPILPCLSDDTAHLEGVIRVTRDHGGSFVIGGGLTMNGDQATLTLAAAQTVAPDIGARWRGLYADDGMEARGQARAYQARIGREVRALCERHGLAWRMPRYIAPGPLAANKRVAERLFAKCYELELEECPSARVWAYRKAAWVVDDWPESLVASGRDPGARIWAAVNDCGPGLIRDIEGWLETDPEIARLARGPWTASLPPAGTQLELPTTPPVARWRGLNTA